MKWTHIFRFRTLSMILLLLVIVLSLATSSAVGMLSSILVVYAQGDYGVWTPLDVGDESIDVVGEKIGSLQGQPFAGWYTDTVIVDPDTGIIVVAWARWNADNYGNDYIYLAFLKPVDADGDGLPEAYQKIVKYVDRVVSLKSLDSLVIGTVNGRKYVVLTWTYYDPEERNNVKAAVYTIDGSYQWSGNIRSTTEYEEYSRSCYVPAYNGGNGGFLIIWYTSYDASIDGKWLYYSPKSGWTLTAVFDIADTNNLYYEKADQMLCIGGNDNALVVFRKWDEKEGYPDLYAALVYPDNSVREVKLYDYEGAEETIGVRGAFAEINGNGYFFVPFISGDYVGYVVLDERGEILYKTTYPGRGYHPYAIGLRDRFVMAWIGADGKVKVGNVDTDRWYIHICSIDSNKYVYHPLITYADDRYVLVYTAGDSVDDLNVQLLILEPGRPNEDPKVVEGPITIVSGTGKQIAHGIGIVNLKQYVIAYTDNSDGEEDLLAYVTLPDVMKDWVIEKYKLPDKNEQALKVMEDIISKSSEIDIAVAYWHDDKIGNMIADWVIKANESGAKVSVVLDNDTENMIIKERLEKYGILVVDDAAVNDKTHIMHDKFIVADDTVIILTANFVESDFKSNDNVVLVIRNASSIAYFYREEARQMLHELFGVDKVYDYSFIVLAIDVYGNKVVFEGYFSPHKYGMKDWIPMAIYGYITRASSKSVIGFTSYIFTTSGYVHPIYEAIVRKQQQGAEVIGIFDEEMNLDVPGRIIYWFVDNDTRVRIDTHAGKMHAKVFAILDEAQEYYVSIIGSWNPTKTATINHDENILVIREEKAHENSLILWLLKELIERIQSIDATSRYRPPHLVITRVMFKPDNSGNPDYEWVEIYNPTEEVIDLSSYVIGDAEDILNGDDEGMYIFPPGSKIDAHGKVIIAYNATAFYEMYGLWPDYEIVDSDPNIPNMIKYNQKMFTGSWNLDDDGDEVILARDENGFLVVIDAVWYGNSNYMKTSLGRPASASPLDISGWLNGYGIIDKAYYLKDNKWDALKMNDKYALGNLSNTPAVISIDFLPPTVLKAYIKDPDGGVQVTSISIGSKTVAGDTVNLSSLNLMEGIYDIIVRGSEDTPVGIVTRTISIDNGLGIKFAPNNESIYVFANTSSINNIVYDYLDIDIHRITVEGILNGKIYVTLPSYWDVNSLEIYVDGNMLKSWSIIENTVMIELTSTSRNLTILGKVPSNINATLSTKIVDLGLLSIQVEDPDEDKGYLWLTVLVNGTKVKSLEGSGHLSCSIKLNISNDLKALYNVTVILKERTPSYVTITHNVTLWVALIPNTSMIVSEGTAIADYKLIRINETHEKIEILLEGPKTVINVTKPRNWERVIAVYYNGVLLDSSKWGIAGSIIWVDPPSGNISILGGMPGKPLATITLGGIARTYAFEVLIGIAIVIIVVLTYIVVRSKSKATKTT